MYRKYLYYFVAVLVFAFSCAFTNDETVEIFGKLGPTFELCSVKAGVTDAQAQFGKETKKINAVSACFFNCILNETNIITTHSGKKTLNTSKYQKLLKSFVPTIGFIKVGRLTAELLDCVLEYHAAPDDDDYPDCAKTAVLVNCLAGAPVLRETITLTLKLPSV